MDRYLCRFNELLESSRLIYLSLFSLSVDLGFDLNYDYLGLIGSESRVGYYDVARNTLTDLPIERLVDGSGLMDSLGQNNVSGFRSSWFNSELYYSTMEDTIQHFLHNFTSFNHISSYFKVSIESSKGLYSLFISSYPFYTVNIIASDFLMINQLNKFGKSFNISDLITVLGSVDFVLGSVDLMI